MGVILQNSSALLSGLWVTVKLCAIIWTLGLTLGPVVGMLAAWAGRGWLLMLRSVSVVLIGTPVLVLLFWTHYPLQRILGVVWDPFWTASLTLGTLNIVVVADAVLAGIRTIPRQYEIAATVSGLNRWACLRWVLIPLTLRAVAPNLLLIQIVMLHATLLSSLISVDETFRVAQRINAVEYQPIPIYTAVAVLFWGVTALGYWGYRQLEQRRKWTLDEQ